MQYPQRWDVHLDISFLNIFIPVCLPPHLYCRHTHPGLYLSPSAPLFSSCPVETQSEISPRSFPGSHSVNFTQIYLLHFFIWECLFLLSLFSVCVNSIANFCNRLLPLKVDDLLQWPTVDYSSALITKKKGAVIRQLLEKIWIIRHFKTQRWHVVLLKPHSDRINIPEGGG